MINTNPFTQFQNLLPDERTTVVTITALNANGTSNATTSTGINVVLIGTNVPVGQQAFVRNGEIIRQAPNLTVTNVAI